MTWLYAPDSYGGFLTAPEAVRLAPTSWAAHPMSDGGEGLLAALRWHRPSWVSQEIQACDVHGRPHPIRVLEGPHGLFVESALAVGPCDGMPPPRQRTSAGLGQVLRALLPRPLVVGLGGSATVDGGLGALVALGAAVRDGLPEALPMCDLSAVTVWCDVQTTLVDCMARFGPQKGLLPSEIGPQTTFVLQLARALNRCRRGRGWPPLPLSLPGGGAAGGLGFALAACGARLVPGAAAFAAHSQLDAAVWGSRGVIVGEGRLDETSYEGKVASVVTAQARSAGLPVVALVGAVRNVPPPPTGPDRITLIEAPTTEAFRAAARTLEEAG